MVNGLAGHHLLRGDFHHLVRDRRTTDVESNGSIAPDPSQDEASVLVGLQVGRQPLPARRPGDSLAIMHLLHPDADARNRLALEIDDAAAHRDVVRDEFQLIDVGLAPRPAQRRAIAVGARDNLGPGPRPLCLGR